VKGLLNGKERFDLGEGRFLRVSEATDASAGTRSSFRLTCSDDGPGWTIELEDLASDPTSIHVDSAHRDLRVALWPVADAVVIAGDSAAFVLSRSTGALLHRLGLEFTGLSADLLQLHPEPSADRLIVVSTKRVWVLDNQGKPIFRYEPEGPIASYEGLRRGTLILREYDVKDASVPLVERRIEID
jgi:hypothetical protein